MGAFTLSEASTDAPDNSNHAATASPISLTLTLDDMKAIREGRKKQAAIRIGPTLADEIKEFCDLHGISKQDLFIIAVRRFISGGK